MGDPKLIVVSGQPRSGTSLMMRMLDVSGVSTLADEPRSYEMEKLNNLAEDNQWLLDLQGAVKILFPLVMHIPVDLDCRVIWMTRAPRQQAASQALMAGRFHSPAFIKEVNYKIPRVFKVMGKKVLTVSFNSLLDNPPKQAKRVSRFVGRPIDSDPVVRRDPRPGFFKFGELESR